MPRVIARVARSTLPFVGVVLLLTAWQQIRPGATVMQAPSSSRSMMPLDEGWRFSLTDAGNMAMPAFNDSSWRTVDLPHDWSAEGPFSANWGSGNGYAPGGIGWYRKHLTLPAEMADRLVAIEFDGVYDHAEVFVNGHLVCSRPYGYSSFDCPMTPHAKFGGADNVIAVRVDHSRFADSRWYTGSGIYRHVRLRVTSPVHIEHWGTVVTTPEVSRGRATIHVETTVVNESDRDRTVLFSAQVLPDESGERLSTELTLAPGERHVVVENITRTGLALWTLDSPKLHTLRQSVRTNSSVLDEVDTSFGIRTIAFDANKGFALNGESVKLKGVCVHHDAGSLGAAVPIGVWERRLRELKLLGVNAIRTSHNPPAPEFLDLCDRLGLLVKDEAFDEFTPAKNKWVAGWNAGVPSRFGYAEDFAEWSVRDASDMVRRDRNHPSIIMWSIGNEIDYPNDPFSHPVLGRSYRPENPRADNLVTLAKPLVDAIHALDRTRPVTAALASLQMSDAVGLPAILDAVGYNYQESRYADDHKQYPARIIFGSENSHTFATWTIVRDNPYVVGQFLWTGIDYLGEAGAFPNRANGAGLLDLAGFKKPIAWFRQSLWSDAPMVYLAASPAAPPATAGAAQPRRAGRLEEHWNWPAGSTVTVSAYTNADEVTLTLNDRPVGTLARSAAVDGVLRWDVPYQPGVLKAVARNNGKTAAEFALTTAGPAARIDLVPDVTTIAADGGSVVHLEYRIVDRNGVRVPNADPDVTFEIQGPARLLGIGNGDLNDASDAKDLVHRAYQGRGLAILQSTRTAGEIRIRATATGLDPATVTVTVR